MFTWENEPALDRVRSKSGDSKKQQPRAVKPFKRDEPNPRDQAFSAVGRQWVESLPVGLRPVNLCDRYPRIVNRVALCWPDLVLRRRLFDDLLVDKRGGRQGFPLKVKAELVALSTCDGPHALTSGPVVHKKTSGTF